MHAIALPSYVKTEGNSTSARSHAWFLLCLFNTDNALKQYQLLLPEYLRTHSIHTPQDVVEVHGWTLRLRCPKFAKNLSEYRLVPVVGIGGEVFSTCVPFNCA